MEAGVSTSHRTCKLPPLILHPFSDHAGPQKLAASSKASLMLEGLLPEEQSGRAELERALLEGRYCEIAMLYYVGKDLTRWIEQCIEVVARDPELCERNIGFQSFATLLIENPPVNVRNKLTGWGVVDYKSIFARALGLNGIFAEAPARSLLSEEFIRFYFKYADHLYACRLKLSACELLDPASFEFDLYASGEYSRMLERQWAE